MQPNRAEESAAKDETPNGLSDREKGFKSGKEQYPTVLLLVEIEFNLYFAMTTAVKVQEVPSCIFP